MATTSPDNLRTPDPGDPYNLVPDLATLAGDVQAALIARANALKGTAAERAAIEPTATPGVLWQDTDGIGMLWVRGSAAFVPAVRSWSGTTTEMNSFGPSAPAGFEWRNTSNNRKFVRRSGSWAGDSPISGVVTFATIIANVANTQTVPLPAGYFLTDPDIQLTAISATGATASTDISTPTWSASSFDLRVDRSAAASNFRVRWTAFPSL